MGEAAARDRMVDNLDKKMKVMEDLDNYLEELEEFSDNVKRYRDLDTEIDEEDIDELMEEELAAAAGTREPALVLCWFIVAVVTMYVVFLGLHGSDDARGR